MTQSEHAAKFAQISRNLKLIADKLCEQHPDYPVGDFARAYLAVGIALLLDAAGKEATVTYLRDLARDLEADEPGSTAVQ
jgi:hypothetical protein